MTDVATTDRTPDMDPLMAEGAWSLPTLIWLPLALVLVLGACVLTGALVRYYRRHRDESETLVPIIGAAITVVALVIGTAWGFYPWQAQYHRWEPVVGTVSAVDSRLLSAGDNGTTQRFVVTLTDLAEGSAGGTGGQYACDDTRCAQVRVGDRLGLSCKRAWQYTGTDGYDCRFVGVTTA